ncbi:MAG: sigma-54-dependent Fis family transcriptional regulator [Xanthobacteraceae bacterium]|nr:MAG: sigma-54-dependent Fis family transcriptional regulator [Xanthobacteraceae bacterium]
MARHHGDRVRAAVLSRTEAARSAVAASWSRSLLVHGLNPDVTLRKERVDDAAYQLARERLGQLLTVTAPVMDRLFAAAGESGCCIVFTDAAGIIVERRGKPGDDAAFQHWGLWTGADWSEGREGTNGIGTCLVEQRPVAIHREQHFSSHNTAMSCMGAPIFDHEGELAGVLDISSCRADLAEAFAVLLKEAVADAARRIETENFQNAFAANRVIMGPGKAGSGPVLFAVDKDDLLIGATRRARKAYGLSNENFVNPRPARDVLEGFGASSDLDAAERAELRRALAHAGGNAAQAARDLGISRASFYRRTARLAMR